jgi:hypothetical protein
VSWLSRIFRGGADASEGDRTALPASAPPDLSAAPPARDEIVASLRRYVLETAAANGRALAAGDLRDDVDFYEAGYLDSLSASSFLVLAEKQYGVQLPDWLMGGRGSTLVKLARYIEREMGASGGRPA